MGRLELPGSVRDQDVANHPQPKPDCDERGDPARQMVAAEVRQRGDRRHETEAEQEVRDEDADDEEGAETEDGSTRRAGVRPSGRPGRGQRLLRGQAEGERREQDQNAKGAWVEAVQEARGDDDGTLDRSAGGPRYRWGRRRGWPQRCGHDDADDQKQESRPRG
jgi:hypothetical protein